MKLAYRIHCLRQKHVFRVEFYILTVSIPRFEIYCCKPCSLNQIYLKKLDLFTQYTVLLRYREEAVLQKSFLIILLIIVSKINFRDTKLTVYNISHSILPIYLQFIQGIAMQQYFIEKEKSDSFPNYSSLGTVNAFDKVRAKKRFRSKC